MTESEERELKTVVYKRYGEMEEKELFLNILIKLEEGNITAKQIKLAVIWGLFVIPIIVSIFFSIMS